MTRRIDKPDTAADVELKGYLDADLRSCFVMMAGAGSGKTTSLVKALDHIGKKHGAELRRRGQKVACITYTEVAVKEIYGDVGNQSLFHVSTIHSFLWTLAKPFQRDIALWVRQRIESKLVELNEKRVGFGAKVHQKTRDENALEISRLNKQLGTIGEVKRFRYESGRDYSKGILGHDDVLKMVPQLVKSRPVLAKIVAQKFPFFFVDESQDTFPEVVDALRKIARQMAGKFCLGFFGDPMQKIYVAGVGDIDLDEGWRKITKPENFRCPTTILSVINKIRSEADNLQQTRGRHELLQGADHPVSGTVQLFILPADHQRSENLGRVRRSLANKYSDPNWTSDALDSGVRILVIAHRMAAARLGFGDLFAAFNDDAPDSLRSGFSEGTTWALKPFLDALLPLSMALEENRQFELMALLRTHCPRLYRETLKRVDNTASLLAVLKSNVCELSVLMSEAGNSTLLEVLKFADQVELVALDERLKEYVGANPVQLHAPAAVSLPEKQGDDDKYGEKTAAAIAAGLACPAKQIRRYYEYISDLSPYSTQQGIKGSEFERVLVVLDDEEGKHPQFSYDKLLGLKGPSRQDNENKSQNKETVFDRTRRLFYVCCSRATKGLAVVLYSADVAGAAAQLKASTLFESADICTVDELPR